jgi:DNA-binding response OmpR family regulator
LAPEALALQCGLVDAAAQRAGASRMKILIVDDEPDLGELLREYVALLGHEATVMPSGRAALDHLAYEPVAYDLALVDWRMPGIAGRDVVQSILTLSPQTRILITTGESADQIRAHRPEGGGWQVLQKPFSLGELQQKMAGLMSSSANSEEPR